jgi:OOP family OmpA-OmpF porin
MGAAQAQNRPYVGVGVVSADNKFDVPGTANRSAEGYKAGGKIFAGADLTPNVGVEVGHADFRKSDVSFTQNGVAGTGETDGRASYIAAKAGTPINEKIAFFGKLGVAHTKNKLSSATPGMSRSVSDNGLYAGLGAQYNLNQQVALTLEYERFGKKRDFGPKQDAVTMAARYNF